MRDAQVVQIRDQCERVRQPEPFVELQPVGGAGRPRVSLRGLDFGRHGGASLGIPVHTKAEALAQH